MATMPAGLPKTSDYPPELQAELQEWRENDLERQRAEAIKDLEGVLKKNKSLMRAVEKAKDRKRG